MIKFIMRMLFLCDHKWYHVKDVKLIGQYDIEYACYIFCPKCEKEKRVSKLAWQRIDRKQQILEEFESGTKQDIS